MASYESMNDSIKLKYKFHKIIRFIWRKIKFKKILKIFLITLELQVF